MRQVYNVAWAIKDASGTALSRPYKTKDVGVCTLAYPTIRPSHCLSNKISNVASPRLGYTYKTPRQAWCPNIHLKWTFPLPYLPFEKSKLRSLMVEDKRQVTSSIFLCPAPTRASDATAKIIINLNKCQIVGEFLKWWSDEILFKKSVIPSRWGSTIACLPAPLRRYRTSDNESWKKFSVRTAGYKVWRRM